MVISLAARVRELEQELIECRAHGPFRAGVENPSRFLLFFTPGVSKNETFASETLAPLLPTVAPSLATPSPDGGCNSSAHGRCSMAFDTAGACTPDHVCTGMACLHHDRAHGCRICTGTGLTPCRICTAGLGQSLPPSASGLGSPLPPMRRDCDRR